MTPAAALRRLRRRFAVLRARRPVVDHAVRAYRRYDAVRGDQLAAAVSFFGFLSFFPLLALGFAMLGYVVELVPDARENVSRLVEDALPGLVGEGPRQIDLDRLADARTGAGVLGLLGLLWAGTAWVDAVRESLRAVFGTGKPTMNLPVRKAWDVAILLALGTAVLVSVSLSSVVSALANELLGTVDLAGSSVADLLLRALTLVLVLTADVVVFAILFVRLPGHRPPWRQVWSGALVGAVGFEVLKLLATVLVTRATRDPVYAGVAVAVGLLVWTNAVARVVVFAASWTATQPAPPEVVRAENGLPPAGHGNAATERPRREPVAAAGAREGWATGAGVAERQAAAGGSDHAGAAGRRDRGRVLPATLLAVGAALGWRARGPH